jgi:hypothetical protein
MKQDNDHLRNLINTAKTLSLSLSQIVNIYTLYDQRFQQLVGIIRQINPLIKDDYAEIEQILEKAISRIAYQQLVPMSPNGLLVNRDFVNAFFFGDIRTAINILDSLYSTKLLSVSKRHKIFISHKSEDEPFVRALVKLLRLYIGSDADKIFCSSVPNYKLGVGKEIYPEIKSQFEEYELFTIIIHSPRYYQSPICLNEMGAAWIQETECYSFLTADCEYKDLKGTIDDRFISIKVNVKDAESRMNEFIEKVLDFFDLPKQSISNLSQWEADRDEFLNEVCKQNR